MIEKCRYCKWFQQIDDKEGLCKRNAPDCNGNFPKVNGNDYCAEFEMRYSRQKANEVIDELVDKVAILTRNREESRELRYIMEHVFRLLWNTPEYPTDGDFFDDKYDEGNYVMYVISSDCLCKYICLKAFTCSKEEVDIYDYITLDELKKKLIE